MTTVQAPPGTVHLFRANADLHQLQHWMSETATRNQDNALHRVLTETFGAEAPTPYRLTRPSKKDQATVLYGYTRQTDESLKRRATAFADPLQSLIIPVDTIQTKEMPRDWQQGDTLGFNIRIRPVTRSYIFEHMRSQEAQGTPPYIPELDHTDLSEKPLRSRAPECDAHTIDCIRRQAANLPLREPASNYAQWLKDLMDRQGGATLHLDSVQLRSLTRSDSSHKTPNNTNAPDAVLQGMLTINEPEAFKELIAKGIGRHKAYGYGMFLLRARA